MVAVAIILYNSMVDHNATCIIIISSFHNAANTKMRRLSLRQQFVYTVLISLR